jgi:hypothetical protein
MGWSRCLTGFKSFEFDEKRLTLVAWRYIFGLLFRIDSLAPSHWLSARTDSFWRHEWRSVWDTLTTIS